VPDSIDNSTVAPARLNGRSNHHRAIAATKISVAALDPNSQAAIRRTPDRPTEPFTPIDAIHPSNPS
jgi:hypothetical protein